MLSAVKEYQGLRPVNITGVRAPYLNIIGWTSDETKARAKRLAKHSNSVFSVDKKKESVVLRGYPWEIKAIFSFAENHYTR